MAANTKRSLEQAMCAGQQFRGAELPELTGHAIVARLIERLVLKTAAGMGYPVNGGTAFKAFNGKTVPVKPGDDWTDRSPGRFRRRPRLARLAGRVFPCERLQPFKQVFRELYTLTPAEKGDGDRSERYAGQQVNKAQAKALFASRGWSTKEDISKRFAAAKLVADVTFDHGWTTPADAAAPAVGRVEFHRHGDWKRLPLKDIPPIVFSEVMRDLDLVVSVAHVGGVDPEATQSTVEMRADAAPRNVRAAEVDQREPRLQARPDSRRLWPLLGPPRQRRACTNSRAGRCASCRSTPSTAAGCFCRSPTTTRGRRRSSRRSCCWPETSEIQDPTILEQIARA